MNVHDEVTPYALLNSSILRWLQKEDAHEDKSRTGTGRAFQAAGPQTAKLRDPQHDSRERGINTDRHVNVNILLTISILIIVYRTLLWFSAAAVKALSEKGIVHRDLKPQNILLCHDGRHNPQPPDITLKIGWFSSVIPFIC